MFYNRIIIFVLTEKDTKSPDSLTFIELASRKEKISKMKAICREMLESVHVQLLIFVLFGLYKASNSHVSKYIGAKESSSTSSHSSDEESATLSEDGGGIIVLILLITCPELPVFLSLEILPLLKLSLD